MADGIYANLRTSISTVQPVKIKRVRRKTIKDKVLARSSNIIAAIGQNILYPLIYRQWLLNHLRLLSSQGISEEHVRTFEENPNIVKARSPLLGACNSDNKQMQRHFYRPA